jgi:hypothetical protein
LKSIPWLSLLKSSALAVIGWALVSTLLYFGNQYVPGLQGFFALLLAPPMNLITNTLVGCLIGAFSLFLLEKSERFLNTTHLWFLVLALAIGMLVYTWSPFRIYRLLGISYSQGTLIGIILGIFGFGNKHWR